MKRGKNLLLIISIIFGIFLICGIVVYATGIDTAKEWHSASSFNIRIDGTDRTLQYAADNNLLEGVHTYAVPSSIPNPGHSAESIWVYTDTVKTLLSALQSGSYGLCKTTASPTYSESGAGHTATEIEVSSGVSLQDRIDSGDFCCTPNCAGLTCGNDPVCGQSCGTCSGTLNTCISGTCCVSNTGATCPQIKGDINCLTYGTIRCDGTCSATYVPAGTSCGTNLICDGSGYCVSTCAPGTGDPCVPAGLDATCITGYTTQCDGSCTGTNITKGTNCIADGTKSCDGLGHCLGWGGTGCALNLPESCSPFALLRYPDSYSADTRECALAGNQGRYYWPDSPATGWSLWVYTRNPMCAEYGCYCAAIPGVCIFSGWCFRDIQWQIKP